MRTLLLGLILGCGPALHGAAILSVEPTPVHTTVGQSFQVGVTLTGLPDVIGFQFDVLFPEFLSLDSVVESGYFAANGVSFYGGTPGVGTVEGIFDVLISPGPLPEPDTLVLLTFTALTEGTGTISLANALLLDSTFAEAGIDALQAADVTVGPAPVVPEPGSLLLLAGGLAALRLLKR